MAHEDKILESAIAAMPTDAWMRQHGLTGEMTEGRCKLYWEEIRTLAVALRTSMGK